MKKLTTFVAAMLIALSANNASAAQANSLDELLSQLEQGKIAQNKQNKKREAEFSAKKDQQDNLLKKVIVRRKQAINLSTKLELNFQDNEVALTNKTDALNKRLCEL